MTACGQCRRDRGYVARVAASIRCSDAVYGRVLLQCERAIRSACEQAQPHNTLLRKQKSFFESSPKQHQRRLGARIIIRSFQSLNFRQTLFLAFPRRRTAPFRNYAWNSLNLLPLLPPPASTKPNVSYLSKIESTRSLQPLKSLPTNILHPSLLPLAASLDRRRLDAAIPEAALTPPLNRNPLASLPRIRHLYNHNG